MAVMHSLTISISAIIITYLITLPVAFYFSQHQGPLKLAVETAIMLPMVLPPTVIGLVLLNLFGRNRGVGAWLWQHWDISLIFTIPGAIIATTIVVLPIMYQGLKAAFMSLDATLIDVARTLAANPWQIFWRVVLPNCWPLMLSGILLSFCRALGEFGATLMVAGYVPGQTDTLATSIYFLIQDGKNAAAAHLAGVNLAIGVLALLLIQILSQPRRHRV